jgi:hypothetical protein
LLPEDIPKPHTASFGRAVVQQPNPVNLPLLCTNGMQASNCRAPEKGHELPSPKDGGKSAFDATLPRNGHSAALSALVYTELSDCGPIGWSGGTPAEGPKGEAWGFADAA